MSANPPATFHYHHEVDVRFRDIDAMGHAHHSLPLVYVEEARAAWWRDVVGRTDLAGMDYVLAEVTVRYQRRIEFPGRLDVGLRVAHVGEKSFVMEFEIRNDAGAVVASGRTVQVMYDYAARRSTQLPEELRARMIAFGGGE
jgi:acyl-CoA thioester hydrolase